MIDRRKFIGSLAAAGVVAAATAAVPEGWASMPFPAFPEYAVEVNMEAYRRDHFPQMNETEFRRVAEDVFRMLQDHLAEMKQGDAFVYDPKYITVKRVT